jgi:glycosyltransferase involved in cell wall biosynthesis
MNTTGYKLETDPKNYPPQDAAKRLSSTILPVSLVITVYNEGKSIDKLLTSILDQTSRPKEFIIVDGGSNDSTPDRIQAFAAEHGGWINLIVDPICNSRHSSSPIAQGRNVGIAAANEELIAVTDAGCVLSPTWLDRIVQPLLQELVDCVGGFYEIQARTKWERYFSILHSPPPDIIPCNFLPSSRSFAFRKSLWEKVGGYPLGYKYGEDTEFVLRLLQVGGEMIIVPQAKVVWTPNHTDRWGGGIKLQFKYSEGNGERGFFVLNCLKKAVFYGLMLAAVIAAIISSFHHFYPPVWISAVFLVAGLVQILLRAKRLLRTSRMDISRGYFLEFSTYLISMDIAFIGGYISGLVKRIIVWTICIG